MHYRVFTATSRVYFQPTFEVEPPKGQICNVKAEIFAYCSFVVAWTCFRDILNPGEKFRNMGVATHSRDVSATQALAPATALGLIILSNRIPYRFFSWVVGGVRLVPHL